MARSLVDDVARKGKLHSKIKKMNKVSAFQTKKYNGSELLNFQTFVINDVGRYLSDVWDLLIGL